MTVGIRDVIVESLIASLTADCITAITQTDPTLVSSVKAGKMIDDPTLDTGNHVRIFYGDPRVRPMRWRDAAVDRSGSGLINRMGGMELAEIGGGEWWWKRFAIQVISNYSAQSYDQDTAREYSQAIVARVKMSLRDNIVSGSDDFGETVQDGAYSKARWEETYETGGEQTWIWRSFVGIEVQTYIS